MTSAARPRVIVADDYPAMIAAIKRLLTPDCDIVETVMDGEALIESATRLQPDVVVADLNLPLVNGLEACRRIKQASPGIQIVVFTALADEAIMEEVLAAGAAAFMSKQSIGGELISAIKKAHADARRQL